MQKAILFDFIVDKENNQIHVHRSFNAPVNLVWKAWTDASILDQWWAPKPYVNQTKSMDFRPGGRWHYSMLSPEGERHWCLFHYKEIEEQKYYNGHDAFCDEDAVETNMVPNMHWHNEFEDQGYSTVVHVKINFSNPEDLETIVSMGFKEGFTMGMGNLDQYLEAQIKLWAIQKTKGPRVCTYVNFPGNTEEAFLFYQTVFGTEFVAPGIQRFGDIPADPNQPPMAAVLKTMILHVELPLLDNHILMGTDAPKEMGFTVTRGNNMHISLEPETREEATRIFTQLSEGGEISMPLQDMFWGAYFGSFTDKFGINWRVNCLDK